MVKKHHSNLRIDSHSNLARQTHSFALSTHIHTVTKTHTHSKTHLNIPTHTHKHIHTHKRTLYFNNSHLHTLTPSLHIPIHTHTHIHTHKHTLYFNNSHSYTLTPSPLPSGELCVCVCTYARTCICVFMFICMCIQHRKLKRLTDSIHTFSSASGMFLSTNRIISLRDLSYAGPFTRMVNV